MQLLAQLSHVIDGESINFGVVSDCLGTAKHSVSMDREEVQSIETMKQLRHGLTARQT